MSCTSGDFKKRSDWRKKSMEEDLRAACSKDSPSLEDIRTLAYPNTVKAPNNRGDLALHLACCSGASLDAIEYLVLQWPDSVSQIDQNGCIPLHWACFGNAHADVVTYLVLRWPDSVRTISHTSDLPIHYACCDGAQLASIKHLVHKWPASLQHQNVNGLLPLHVACSFRQSQLSVIKYLIKRYPGSVGVATNNGMLPVDLARKNGAPEKVISYLAQHNITKTSSQVTDKAGAQGSLNVTSTPSQDSSFESQFFDSDEHPATVVFADDDAGTAGLQSPGSYSS